MRGGRRDLNAACNRVLRSTVEGEEAGDSWMGVIDDLYAPFPFTTPRIGIGGMPRHARELWVNEASRTPPICTRTWQSEWIIYDRSVVGFRVVLRATRLAEFPPSSSICSSETNEKVICKQRRLTSKIAMGKCRLLFWDLRRCVTVSLSGPLRHYIQERRNMANICYL